MNPSDLKTWLLALPRKARGAVLAFLTVVASLLLLLLTSVGASLSENWSDIAKNQPRIARLKGYQAFQPSMLEASSAAEVLLDELAFAAASDESQTGAQLQQLLRGFAEDAGLTVRGSQLIPIVQQEETPEGFVQLTVELRMRGMPLALNLFLRDVYEHSPRLKVTELNAVKVRDRRTSRRRGQNEQHEEQNLDLSIQVAALMVSA